LKQKTKAVILVIVAFLTVVALVGPQLTGPSEFQVTPNPATAFEAAKKSGQPIFLEFYAKW